MRLLVPLTLSLCGLFFQSHGEETKRTCRIIFPQRPQGAPQEAYLFDGTASRKVPLSGMNFSDALPLPAGDLVLRMTSGPAGKPEEIPQDAPQATIAAGTTQLYLVVLSDPENPVLPVRLLSLDAGSARLAPGQTLWANLTKHNIVGEMGDQSLTIPPGENVIGKAPLPANGYFKAKFRYQPNGSGDFLPVMEKSWWFDAKSRNLGFIVDSKTGFPSIFTFRDNQPPATP